ncbi:RNA polymerase sigma-70 factor [Adhaeribacter arboris]|uniref:RNA polymerase sigma-70 factor n=1 Tax=Adhaeribacter arboris TaxID=2072846 RepID=A0A2T2YEV2_9BACT|nr:RNA polymerase sigma-70 factor [Adhaeribacter arboris]PSR54032.1 RNA polymerase sigma-70 factor [Adhaeribacter arboris]
MFASDKLNSEDCYNPISVSDRKEEVVPTNLNDSELFIRKAFENSPAAGYEMLFRRYYRPLCSHVARITLSRDIAEDLVADVFFSFWEHQLYQKNHTSYRAYLFVAARNQALSYLRSGFHKRPKVDIYENDPLDKKALPDEMLQYNELYLKIDKLIKEVSPQSQKVFIMSRFEGMKNALIADKLEISVKTVEGHITRVLHILRKILKKDAFLTLVGMVQVLMMAEH